MRSAARSRWRVASGQGTAFTLSLPVTLAIVRSLIVEVDQERYAVPLSHVAETVRAEPEAIRQINNRGVTQWRGDLIHVADGGAVLGTAGVVAGAAPLLRRHDGGRQAARAAGGPAHRAPGRRGEGTGPGARDGPTVVSGTTILGDGRVACILDVVRILDGAAHVN